MLKPSSRKMRPSSGVSYTSRSWKGVWRRSTSVPSNQTPLPSFRRSRIFSDTPCLRVGDALLLRQVAAPLEALDQAIGGRERAEQRFVDRLRLARVVAGEVADVHIQRCAIALRPGMDRQVRFGQHDRARGSPLLGAIGAVELDEMVPEDREAGILAGLDANIPQRCRRNHVLALTAAVQVGNDVQSLHRDTPFKAKIRWKDLHMRPRALPLLAGRPQTEGGGC